jgi:hypothetical protein
MSKLRLLTCGASFLAVLSSVALCAPEPWKVAATDTLVMTKGGQSTICYVKCSSPNSCPTGARFDCVTIQCSGTGACPTSSGTDHRPNDYCDDCDEATSGKTACGASSSFYCEYTLTCGNCTYSSGTNTYKCTESASSGIGSQVTDKGPSGSNCP